MFISGASLDSLNLQPVIDCSSRTFMQASPSSNASNAELGPPAVGDWIWKPWYAKLWWAAIPIYWAGAAASLKIPVLAEFYTSALAGYLNMLFFPPTALLMLGFGFARAWLYMWGQDDGPPLTDEEIAELEEMKMRHEAWPDRRPGQPHPAFDIYDPRSGVLFVGNPNGINGGKPL